MGSKNAKDLSEQLRIAERQRQSADAEVRRLLTRVAELEKGADDGKKPKKSIAPPRASTRPPPELARFESMMERVKSLRETLATTSAELSQLHADEVSLSKKRARVLADACAVLARAVGETGQAPPPMPSTRLEARLSIAPSVDISEVAELLESLRPPRVT